MKSSQYEGRSFFPPEVVNHVTQSSIQNGEQFTEVIGSSPSLLDNPHYKMWQIQWGSRGVICWATGRHFGTFVCKLSFWLLVNPLPWIPPLDNASLQKGDKFSEGCGWFAGPQVEATWQLLSIKLTQLDFIISLSIPCGFHPIGFSSNSGITGVGSRGHWAHTRINWYGSSWGINDKVDPGPFNIPPIHCKVSMGGATFRISNF